MWYFPSELNRIVMYKQSCKTAASYQDLLWDYKLGHSNLLGVQWKSFLARFLSDPSEMTLSWLRRITSPNTYLIKSQVVRLVTERDSDLQISNSWPLSRSRFQIQFPPVERFLGRVSVINRLYHSENIQRQKRHSGWAADLKTDYQNTTKKEGDHDPIYHLLHTFRL